MYGNYKIYYTFNLILHSSYVFRLMYVFSVIFRNTYRNVLFGILFVLVVNIMCINIKYTKNVVVVIRIFLLFQSLYSKQEFFINNNLLT